MSSAPVSRRPRSAAPAAPAPAPAPVPLPSENHGYGFWGEFASVGLSQLAWLEASRAVSAAVPLSPLEVRVFLDSRYGRWFAEAVSAALVWEDGYCSAASVAPAVAAAVLAWRAPVSAAESRSDGIPAGLSVLYGRAVAASLAAELEG